MANNELLPTLPRTLESFAHYMPRLYREFADPQHHTDPTLGPYHPTNTFRSPFTTVHRNRVSWYHCTVIPCRRSFESPATVAFHVPIGVSRRSNVPCMLLKTNLLLPHTKSSTHPPGQLIRAVLRTAHDNKIHQQIEWNLDDDPFTWLLVASGWPPPTNVSPSSYRHTIQVPWFYVHPANGRCTFLPSFAPPTPEQVEPCDLIHEYTFSSNIQEGDVDNFEMWAEVAYITDEEETFWRLYRTPLGGSNTLIHGLKVIPKTIRKRVTEPVGAITIETGMMTGIAVRRMSALTPEETTRMKVYIPTLPNPMVILANVPLVILPQFGPWRIYSILPSGFPTEKISYPIPGIPIGDWSPDDLKPTTIIVHFTNSDVNDWEILIFTYLLI